MYCCNDMCKDEEMKCGGLNKIYGLDKKTTEEEQKIKEQPTTSFQYTIKIINGKAKYCCNDKCADTRVPCGGLEKQEPEGVHTRGEDGTGVPDIPGSFTTTIGGFSYSNSEDTTMSCLSYSSGARVQGQICLAPIGGWRTCRFPPHDCNLDWPKLYKDLKISYEEHKEKMEKMKVNMDRNMKKMNEKMAKINENMKVNMDRNMKKLNEEMAKMKEGSGSSKMIKPLQNGTDVPDIPGSFTTTIGGHSYSNSEHTTMSCSSYSSGAKVQGQICSAPLGGWRTCRFPPHDCNLDWPKLYKDLRIAYEEHK